MHLRGHLAASIRAFECEDRATRECFAARDLSIQPVVVGTPVYWSTEWSVSSGGLETLKKRDLLAESAGLMVYWHADDATRFSGRIFPADAERDVPFGRLTMLILLTPWWANSEISRRLSPVFA